MPVFVQGVRIISALTSLIFRPAEQWLLFSGRLQGKIKPHVQSVLEATSLNKTAESDSQHLCYKQPLTFSAVVQGMLQFLVMPCLFYFILILCVCARVTAFPSHSAGIKTVD